VSNSSEDIGIRLDRINTVLKSMREELDSQNGKLKSLWEDLRDQKADFRTLAGLFGELLVQISDRFVSFQKALESVDTAVKKADQSITEGSELVSKKIAQLDDTSSKGLAKVSSGVALVEVLQAQAASVESMTAITLAIGDIGERFATADRAVQMKKGEFDSHYDETVRGFQAQLQVIASHIFDLVDRAFFDFDSMRSVPADSKQVASEVKFAQGARLAARRSHLSANFAHASIENLKNVVAARDNLRQELSNKILLEMDSETETLFPTSFIPVAAARVGRRVRVIATLDSEGQACDKPPAVAPGLRNALRHIEESCAATARDQGVWNKEEKDSLIRALDNLRRAGMLSADDLRLICEHLAEYSLAKLTLA
jgi:hypothetical protein